KGAHDSPAAQCATRLTALTADVVRSSIDDVHARLAADTRQAEAEEAAEREGCHRALGTLLAADDAADGSSVVRMVHNSGGRYDATVQGKSELGFAWRFELEIPGDHVFASSALVERLLPQFELQAPELSGWIRKEVKIRPQRLERCLITEVV